MKGDREGSTAKKGEDERSLNMSIKRVYEKPSPDDGYRVLVDRLWPRGLTREKAHIDEWLKEAAPSRELRRWYGHDAEKWPDFKKRYSEELGRNADLVDAFRKKALGRKITLLYSSKEERYNNAQALMEYLESDGEKK
ncbi:MAG TPA: DUF488 family protein [Syntrophales bacterium]|nr:DUF488 family protein [Syntrophales bacterium]